MNIKDFKWTEKRFGTTFANILKRLGSIDTYTKAEIDNKFYTKSETYNKTETYSKTEIDNKIGNVEQLLSNI